MKDNIFALKKLLKEMTYDEMILLGAFLEGTATSLLEDSDFGPEDLSASYFSDCLSDWSDISE